MRSAHIDPGQQILPVDLLYHRDEEIPSLLADCELDALILGLDEGRYELHAEQLPDIPMVNVHPDRLTPEIPTIAIEPQSLAQATIDYFQSLGIRSLATIHTSTTEAQSRVNRHLRDLGAKTGCSFRNYEFSVGGIVANYESRRTILEIKEFDEWLRDLDHPTGLLSSGGYTAATVIHAASRAGLAVPDSLSVLSRSDDNVCLFADPPISSFRSVGPSIGRIALSLLARHLAGGPLPRGEVALPAPSIVERDSTGVPGGIESSLSHAVHFIRRNALKGITLDDVLAATPGISRTQLYRRFEDQFGCSPAREILRLRLAEAMFQLRFTSKSLSEIASHCAFKTLAHFSKVFSRESGHSPGTWRARNQLPE